MPKRKNGHFQPLNLSKLSIFFYNKHQFRQEVKTNQVRLQHLKLNLLFHFSSYLIPSTLVSRHVPFKQSAVREAAAAFWTAEGLLGLLVTVPDVLLQRAVALVAARAVRAGE